MKTNMEVPFLNLNKQYLVIKSEIDAAIHTVLDSSNYIKGNQVKEFEDAFAEYVQAKYCIGVGNGTDALSVSLIAYGIKPGDEVITVPNTFIATVEAIVAIGATPVLADINPRTYSLDPDTIASLITEKTKAIIPVHLYGIPCDMETIRKVADKHHLKVIYDAAQAHGALYNGKSIAQYGDATTYSFYPGKNLGAYGDGGAIVTNDAELADRIRMLADHGRKEKYLHEMFGYNSRLDTLQAAVLKIKLQHLDKWNARRKEIAALYKKELDGVLQVTIPEAPAYADPVWHLFVIRTPDRDNLQVYLKGNGIQTGIHYPVPIPLQPVGQGLKHNCDINTLTEIGNSILSIPMCPEMTDEMVCYVAENIKDYFA